MPEAIAVIGVAVYGFMFFVLWKFYQVFSNINQNLAGIRRAIEQNSQRQ
jgi:hypothetical protein